MDESTTRVFFAITLDDNIKSHINYQIEFLKKNCNFQVRWVKDTQLHLTLRFVGNITSYQLEEFCNDFQELENAPTFDLELDDIIALPTNKPRVIGVGIRLTGSLTSLVDLLEKKLGQFGIEAEERSFTPHITLGRISKPRRKTFMVTNVALPPKQHVEQITLFKSQLTPNGSIYTPLKIFKLKSM